MLAVAGGKGGAGKTTSTLCLAAALAERGAAPVVVDADRSMPNLHVAAGTPSTPGVAAFATGQSLDAATHRSPELPGVRVLPTAPGTDEKSLRRALTRLPECATAAVSTPVLVDCPAGAGRDAALPLQFADGTLLVSTARRASLAGTAKTAAMARALGAPPVGCVLTRTVTEPTGIERLLDCPVVACLPPAESPLTEATVRDAFGSFLSSHVLPGTLNRVGLL